MSIRVLARAVQFVGPTNILLNKFKTPLCGCQQFFYSVKSPNLLNADDISQVTPERAKKKTALIPRITLIHGDELTVTSLEEAQKLSKRRDLKLVKIIDLDTKTQRPVYKLMTGSEYFAEDLKQRELKKKQKQSDAIKGEKVLILRHNITEHDLMTDVRKINKWVAKHYEVRVVINGDANNMDKAEKVYSFLENSLKSTSRVLQKIHKGSNIKFHVMPPKKDKDNEEKKL